MRKSLALLLSLALIGCSNKNMDFDASAELTQCRNPNPKSFLLKIDETKFDLPSTRRALALRSQSQQIDKVWGKEDVIQSDNHRFVKYLDSFKTRADIHFDTGKIFISTIDKNQPLEKLRKAILQVVLLPANLKNIDVLGSENIKYHGAPFFKGQILDHNGKSITTEEQANLYADFLLTHHLQEKKFIAGSASYVEMALVKNHKEIREYQFSSQVRAAATRYDISEDLIYAVIKTESSFNPLAVSHAGAIGLMQVVPSTAGADVFKLVKNKEGIPSEEYLFDPENNIDTGVAYLSLLKNRYLKDLANGASKHFSIISAYNGGTGNVLTTFDNDRKMAVEKINMTHPKQVYCILTQHHPKEESRNYLKKVLKAQRNFNLNQV